MKKLILFAIGALFVVCIGIVSKDFLLTLSVAGLSGGTLFSLMEKNKSENEKITEFFIILATILAIIIITPIVAESINKSLIASIGFLIMFSLLWWLKRLFYKRKG